MCEVVSHAYIKSTARLGWLEHHVEWHSTARSKLSYTTGRAKRLTVQHSAADLLQICQHMVWESLMHNQVHKQDM